ncbi:MAG: Rare lipoprotein A [uncultured bacterium]|nr:MAG: Rare lipoprotein A [uncultured bacterium]
MKTTLKISLSIAIVLSITFMASRSIAVSNISSTKTLGQTQLAKASWYGPGFHGRKTANGETYNMYGISVAHKSLPFNTWLRVTNLKNSQRLFVRVNDRGPYIEGRTIDLSLGAATALKMTDQGVANVKIEIFKPDSPISRSLNEIYNIPKKVVHKKVAKKIALR